jgi:hypothetical protein
MQGGRLDKLIINCFAQDPNGRPVIRVRPERSGMGVVPPVFAIEYQLVQFMPFEGLLRWNHSELPNTD